MIRRRITAEIESALERQAAVCLLGPRQVGKTTLALEVAARRTATYLDLESPEDRRRLSEPELFLSDHADELVVIDEVQRAPGLFEVLRGVIDRGRREGRGTGRFLLLGSASRDLLRQSSETLAGRITYIELSPLDVSEVGDADTLWLRGGFPVSYLAASDHDSFAWRRDFIRTYLERDIPQLGPRIPAETLRRFWTMLAHQQGATLNGARIASGLGIAGSTVARYLDLMVDLLLVRRLEPWHGNVGKRLVKSPKVYVRDSGITLALLGIADRDTLMGHPVLGPSWEGFVIENLISIAGDDVTASFYRSSGGAEADLVLTWPDSTTWVVEVKRSLSPTLERGLRSAIEVIEPDRSFVVYPGRERFRLAERVEVISLIEMIDLTRAFGGGIE